jgi:hypothetical protein
MAENAQTACQICDEAFEEGDLVLTYREWPGAERLGHFGCVASISMDVDDEDDE